MAITIPAGFIVIGNDPIDSRMLVADATTRKSTSNYGVANAFHGLLVYQQDTNKLYSLLNPSDVTQDSSWQLLSGGGDGNPGGTDTQIQFNSGSEFGGSARFTFDVTTGATNISGSLIVKPGTTGDFFLIQSGSTTIAKVDENGNFILPKRTGVTPTAVDGGIMFSSSAFYVGI